MIPDRDDPLNEILLPAYDLAARIKSGERSSRPGEKVLAAAVLVLIAERGSMGMSLAAAKQARTADRDYLKALEKEADAAAIDRAKSYLRLRNRTGVVT